MGLHLNLLETAGFFVVGFSPALAVYSGWLARACGGLHGKQARLLWNFSIAINCGYFLLFRTSTSFSSGKLLADLWTGWLVLAICLSIRGLLTEGTEKPNQRAGWAGQLSRP
jgi:hypothetical protein